MADAVIPTASVLVHDLSETDSDSTTSDEDIPDNNTVASFRTDLSTKLSQAIRRKLDRGGAEILAREVSPDQHDEASIDRISLLFQMLRNVTLGLQRDSPPSKLDPLPAPAGSRTTEPSPSVAMKMHLANKLQELDSARLATSRIGTHKNA